MKNFRWRLPVLVLVACAAVVTAARVAAAPLHDPFLEKFQVGTWSNPAAIELANGYPAGLLEPVKLDTVWTNAAAKVLDAAATGPAGGLTARLLGPLFPAGRDTVWLRQANWALRDLVAGREGNPAVPFLRNERLAAAFGRVVAAGDLVEASRLAGEVLAAAAVHRLPAREELIWDLRRRLLQRLNQTGTAGEEELWPAMVELGPFDAVNAWQLWVVCRREASRPVLPPAADPKDLVRLLGRLPTGSVTAAELYGSTLAGYWQSALGAILLDSKDLPAHFKKFPHPPDRFAQQGMWVRGQRRLRRGLAGSYEQLAARPGLKPGWQLDVWRRASEIRILKGAWVEGLADLRQALRLAEQGHGTKALRRRLRQWTEQALVLALAQNDLRTARELRDLGLARFVGPERVAFADEIQQWQPVLSTSGTDAVPSSDDAVDVARFRIQRGLAPDLAPATPAGRQSFVAAADQQLWPLWYRWGVTLANPSRVNEDRRRRAIAYQNSLLANTGSPAAVDSALALVGRRFRGRPWAGDLLRGAFARDVRRVSGWRTAPRPSPVPALLPEVRGSELDRHALLGFCLAAGDMRGILGLAFELPGRGLTRAEKRLFLYPLPAAGAIREAIAAADNEPALLLAVARNESLFEPAVRSRAGALGWMQIMPFHYPQNGAVFGAGNWRVPAVSVQRGDGLLTENRRRYGGDPYRTVAAYNAGPGAAGRWDRQLGGEAPRDIYLAWIGYPETRAYVEKVLIDRDIYNGIIDAGFAASPSGPTAGRNNE